MALENARLVQHHARVVLRVEVLDHLIVRDDQIAIGLRFLAAILDGGAELRFFFDRLLCHAQRGKDQDAPSGVRGHLSRPLGLHRRLAQAGVCEDRRATALACPIDNRSLEVEKMRSKLAWRKACRHIGRSFGPNERVVAYNFCSHFIPFPDVAD